MLFIVICNEPLYKIPMAISFCVTKLIANFGFAFNKFWLMYIIFSMFVNHIVWFDFCHCSCWKLKSCQIVDLNVIFIFSIFNRVRIISVVAWEYHNTIVNVNYNFFPVPLSFLFKAFSNDICDLIKLHMAIVLQLF